MKPRHSKRPPAAAARAALLLLCLLAPAAAFAQARVPQPHHPPAAPRFDPIPQPPSVRERQLILDEMERTVGRGAPRKAEELRMSEIAEDYRDLQQVNNKMMGAVMRSAAPDYKLIAGSAAEIRRRAERLRENLALPAPQAKGEGRAERLRESLALPEPGPKPAEDAAGMKAALLALDRSIMSFVRSPLFKNTGVVHAEEATKAGRDLADVIERSRLAAKDAERLGKKGKN